MKKNLQILLFALFGCYIWFGNASGPGAFQNLDRTGSPVSPGYCGVSSCHGGGNFGTAVSMELLDANQENVTEYVPGEQYRLIISIAAQGAQNYGFQAVALLDGGNEGAGEFGEAGAGTQITNIDNREYFEHNSPSTSSSFEIDWVAPETGSGDITFYAAGNAVNGNFEPSGDDPDTTSLKVMEGISSGIYDRVAQIVNLEVYPSMAQHEITSRWSPDITADRLTINDLTGRIYYIKEIQADVPAALNIPVYSLPSGIYFVRLTTSAGLQTRKFVKL